jgi:serine/threonine protein phosphatase PrpC
MVNDNEVCRLVSAGFDANALCEAADDAGGRDNTSVILIEIK